MRRKPKSRSKLKLSKDGAKLAIQKAKAFVLYTIDFDGKIHIESNTEKADEKDVKQQSIMVLDSYVKNLSLAAIGRHKEQVESKRIIGAKEARSIELSGK